MTAPTSSPLERHPLVQRLVMMLPVSGALVSCPGPDASDTRCSVCPIARSPRTPGPCILPELATEALSLERPRLTVVRDARRSQ